MSASTYNVYFFISKCKISAIFLHIAEILRIFAV